MSFDWSQYLNLAYKLAGTPHNPANEAELRSAISRAYYAAFIKARNFLRDVDNLTIPRRDGHKYVINHFENNSDKRRREIGNNLHRLRDFRNDADYADTVLILAYTTQRSLTFSTRIISTLSTL
ncbi:MAG TPA: hypothetical protein V6D13_04710 [Halomicronema sp.]